MPTTSRKIFIDSSILVAFIDRGSRNHLLATKAIEDLASLNYSLYTSSQVITDSYDLLLNEVGKTVALEFLQTMLQSGIELLFPQKADIITAHRILKVNNNREIALSEALNATLMQKRGIIQVLTFNNWSKLFGTTISNLISI